MRKVNLMELDKALGMEKEVSKIREAREKRIADAKTKKVTVEKAFLEDQSYKMINSSISDVVPNFEVIHDCHNMDEAIEFFLAEYATEFPGCNIVQIKGINPKYGPNFLCASLETTEEQRMAFVNKYGKVPYELARFEDMIAQYRH